MAQSWRLPAHASLFGKLPTVLDYVRINHSYPPAIALDEWMSRALSDLTVSNLSWPSARFRFLFAPGGSEHALLGVFGPSKDRAGRKFPLSIFTPLPVAAIARKFAALPRAEEFFSAAEALLDQAASLTREVAAERLQELPSITPDKLDQLHEELQVALDDRSHASVVQELFGGAEHEADDAFSRAAATFAKHRSAAPERALTLDCPITSTDDVCAWTSLAEVCLSWGLDAPSLFWTAAHTALASERPSESGRLLISLGTPLPALPIWLADKKRKNERLISLHSLSTGYAATSSASGTPVWTPPPETPVRTQAPEKPVWTPPPATPAPSASAPTPVRAPIPVPGASTPPQGFAITPPAVLQHATVPNEPARPLDSDGGDERWAANDDDDGVDAPGADAGAVLGADDSRGAHQDADAEGADGVALGQARLRDGVALGRARLRDDAPNTAHAHVEADPASEPHVEAGADTNVPAVAPGAQPRGVSLWRKLRALATSG